MGEILMNSDDGAAIFHTWSQPVVNAFTIFFNGWN